MDKSFPIFFLFIKNNKSEKIWIFYILQKTVKDINKDGCRLMILNYFKEVWMWENILFRER